MQQTSEDVEIEIKKQHVKNMHEENFFVSRNMLHSNLNLNLVI